MNTFLDRLAADWSTLAVILDDHPLLWVPALVCMAAFLERLWPTVVWLCAGALYAVTGLFALIVGWRERHHGR